MLHPAAQSHFKAHCNRLHQARKGIATRTTAVQRAGAINHALHLDLGTYFKAVQYLGQFLLSHFLHSLLRSALDWLGNLPLLEQILRLEVADDCLNIPFVKKSAFALNLLHTLQLVPIAKYKLLFMEATKQWQNPTSSLFSLPWEVREMVYMYSLPEIQHRIELVFHKKPLYFHPLALTCAQARAEWFTVYFSQLCIDVYLNKYYSRDLLRCVHTFASSSGRWKCDPLALARDVEIKTEDGLYARESRSILRTTFIPMNLLTRFADARSDFHPELGLFGTTTLIYPRVMRLLFLANAMLYKVISGMEQAVVPTLSDLNAEIKRYTHNDGIIMFENVNHDPSSLTWTVMAVLVVTSLNTEDAHWDDVPQNYSWPARFLVRLTVRRGDSLVVRLEVHPWLLEYLGHRRKIAFLARGGFEHPGRERGPVWDKYQEKGATGNMLAAEVYVLGPEESASVRAQCEDNETAR